MKKIGLIFFSLCVSLQLSATETVTTTTFKDVAYNGVTSKENEYGETILYKEARIKTQNFKVNNFWDKFSDSNKGTSTYTQVSKIGTFELSIKASFACAKGGLAAEGCSGQKPFLLNDGLLNNPDMQKAADGSDLPSGEYRIPFDDAANYAVGNIDAFYALDVDRNENFYTEPKTPPPAGKESPFSYILGLFKDRFSKDVKIFGDPLTPDAAAMRDRYIANIVYGHDDEHKLKKAVDGASATAIDTIVPAANDPVSLLDYEEELITETSGCKGFILSFKPESLRCRVMTGFGIANWMPFFSSDSTYEVESKSVMADTENTLLALAGELNDKNYILDAKKDSNGNFLTELFKPMTFMFSSMSRFWFGSGTPKTVEAVVAEFNFEKYLPLTFALTDGDEVSSFKHFALMGIESVYGTEVESCKIKTGWWTSSLITAGVPSNEDVDFNDGFMPIGDIQPSAYTELTKLNKVSTHGMMMFKYQTLDMTTDDWLNWCKRNQGRRSKGIFGRFFDAFGTMFSQPSTYDDQIDNIVNGEYYSVIEYKEKVHRGLILHLQEAELELGNSGTSTTYKLLNVR